MTRSHSLLAAFALALSLFGAACTHDPQPLSAANHGTDQKPSSGTVSFSKKDDVAVVRAKLAEHRKEQLERLEAYSNAGIFPRNYASKEPLHMLKDDDGRYCAVANLVHLDGYDDALDAEAETHNDLQFADVRDGALYDWILTSGLTQEEVAKIQAPAPQIVKPSKPEMKPQGPSEDDVKVQLQAHFEKVEKEILANTDQSLDVAVARLEANPEAMTATR